MKNTAVLVLSLSLAGGTLVAQDATVKSLLSKDLAGIPGKELSMITVELPARRVGHREWKSASGGKRERNRAWTIRGKRRPARIQQAEYCVFEYRPGGESEASLAEGPPYRQADISSLLHKDPQSGRLKEV